MEGRAAHLFDVCQIDDNILRLLIRYLGLIPSHPILAMIFTPCLELSSSTHKNPHILLPHPPPPPTTTPNPHLPQPIDQIILHLVLVLVLLVRIRSLIVLVGGLVVVTGDVSVGAGRGDVVFEEGGD